MSNKPAIQIAVELQRLGVSKAGIIDILTNYPHDVIERQLLFLPYRKAKRKEAFIIDAIRNNYSAPKEFYYASNQTPPPDALAQLDEDAEPDPGHADANPQGYGATDTPDSGATDNWLATGGYAYDLDLPSAEQEDGPQ